MLNSENIIWRAKFVDIYFLSRGKFMSCSLDFQFLIFLKRSINFESFDVLMSICEIEYVFWIILWIVNCFDIKLDQLIDIVICNIFKRNLALFEGLIPNCYRNYCYYWTTAIIQDRNIDHKLHEYLSNFHFDTTSDS